jgi:hypothetical protein
MQATRRFAGDGAAVVSFVLILLVSAAAIAGSGGVAPSAPQSGQPTAASLSQVGFLQKDESDALFVRWTRAGNVIAGRFFLSANGDFPGATYPFTGSISGDEVTIRFGKTFPEPETMTGTVSASRLHLTESDTIGIGGDFTAAAFTDFKAAQAALKGQAKGSPTPQADLGPNAALIANVHMLQISLQEYAVKHGDNYPKEVTPSTLKGIVATWPANPFANGPMTVGKGAGDYRYTASGSSFQLTGYGRNGSVLIVVP